MLRLPPDRQQGADPWKLQKQIAAYGRSLTGMPTIHVSEILDDELMIMDGVTRATRAAKLCPGTLVTVEVIDNYPVHPKRLATVGEKLP